jgi:hypothetical protein
MQAAFLLSDREVPGSNLFSDINYSVALCGYILHFHENNVTLP